MYTLPIGFIQKRVHIDWFWILLNSILNDLVLCVISPQLVSLHLFIMSYINRIIVIIINCGHLLIAYYVPDTILKRFTRARLILITYEYYKTLFFDMKKWRHRETVPKVEQLVNARDKIWTWKVNCFIHYTWVFCSSLWPLCAFRKRTLSEWTN